MQELKICKYEFTKSFEQMNSSNGPKCKKIKAPYKSIGVVLH